MLKHLVQGKRGKESKRKRGAGSERKKCKNMEERKKVRKQRNAKQEGQKWIIVESKVSGRHAWKDRIKSLVFGEKAV